MTVLSISPIAKSMASSKLSKRRNFRNLSIVPPNTGASMVAGPNSASDFMPDKALKEVNQRAAALSPPLKSAEPGSQDTLFSLNAPYKELPSTILPNLYLGTKNSAASSQILNQLNVSHVLNLAEEEDNPFADLQKGSEHMAVLPKMLRHRRSISLLASKAKWSRLGSSNSSFNLFTVMENEGVLRSHCPNTGEFSAASAIEALQMESSSTNRAASTVSPHSAAATDSIPSTPSSQETQSWPPAYKKLAWGHNQDNIAKDFTEAFDFINEARLKRQGVLVHCQLGVSRSATLIIAYVMKTLRMRLPEAYAYVKAKRPQVSPNMTLICQLSEFEKTLGFVDNQHRHARKRSIIEPNLFLRDST